MIRIKKVKIENFQSHENTELVFDKGLNVIVGPSDQGKSAVLRAIKWVLYNEPRGNEFIRQGTKGARVTIEISNGYTITRERTQSKNRYILEDAQGQSSIFEGFGNEVPLEIIKAHGIPKVVLDTDIRSNLNFGEQLEGPFLISESGALRAKAIGRLTGLHIIDKSIRDTAADLRRESQTGERLKDELKSIGERLEEYKDLEILEGNLVKSEEVIRSIEDLLKRVERLEALKHGLNENNSEYVKTRDILIKLSRVNECEEYLRNGELGLARLHLIEGIHKRSETLEAGIEEMQKVLKETLMVNEGIS
ncbi:MAG: AAA family ATPase, partial [Clostridiaceae bacterium]|nr:AAA family ATPase [Clostridiaceae bacterium]